MTMSIKLFLVGITTLFGLGFLLPLILPYVWSSPKASELSAKMALGAGLLGSGLGTLTSVIAWVTEKNFPKCTFSVHWWLVKDFLSLPPLQFVFRLDNLSTFFLFLVSTFALFVAIYSFGALEAEHYQRYASQITAGFNLFVWATLMIVVAYDLLSMLLLLEVMTLAFGYLALYKHTLYQDTEDSSRVSSRKQKNARLASMVYMAVSHTSTVFLLVASLLLAIQANSVNFETLIQKQPYIQQDLQTLVFMLALIGLGIRTGLTPAHIWVPLVHPSSPTTTHALSLGIAIKIAIYLMYRFFFQFLSPQPLWGGILIFVAVLTAMVNVWYAISSHDLKEALAYHSIENIGIICVGMGLGLFFWEGHRSLATLALVASLYHLLNHAVFKSLLYMATGSIDNLTHQTVELDSLGGLIKMYPLTSAMFLIGSFAIAGFPPLNGFISEWLTLQAFFGGLIVSSASFYFVLLILSLLMLVSSFALTAFCFYKMAGIALLGKPRLPKEKRQKWESQDSPWTMKGVMLVLAGLTLMLGTLPGIVVSQLLKALMPLKYVESPFWSMHLQHFSFAIESVDSKPFGATLPILSLSGLAILLFIFLVLVSRRSVKRPSVPWGCGVPRDMYIHTQYTSAAASFSLRHLFSCNLPKFQNIPDYFPAYFVLSQSQKNPQKGVEYFRIAYNWILAWLLAFSEKFGGKMQNGDIRRYLTYIFVFNLLALLLFLTQVE